MLSSNYEFSERLKTARCQRHSSISSYTVMNARCKAGPSVSSAHHLPLARMIAEEKARLGSIDQARPPLSIVPRDRDQGLSTIECLVRCL